MPRRYLVTKSKSGRWRVTVNHHGIGYASRTYAAGVAAKRNGRRRRKAGR